MSLTQSQIDEFHRKGFLIGPRVLDDDAVERMPVRLDAPDVLPSRFDAQHGLFSLLRLSAAELALLREEHGIFIGPQGRINVSSLNEANVDYFCSCLSAALATGNTARSLLAG